ncbi:MAG TPA: GNAT family N-acetyltransferase [Acidimicrobiales bacterium]|nr:GNAT family N-acetyltransferase [Acidimicrobiales bacterium]
MSPTIRAGRASDLDSVLRLWTEAAAEPTHTDDAAGLDILMGRDPGALIVAEDDGRLVGSVIAAWDGWRGSIYRLVVAPSHRRMGLSRRLLHQAEARLSEQGAVRLQAIVIETETLATAFWASTGWDRQVERIRFVKG